MHSRCIRIGGCNLGNCFCMADVFPKIFRLAAFSFYDVGLEPFHCFLLWLVVLLLHFSRTFISITFPIILSLFSTSSPIITICFHNSGDSISPAFKQDPPKHCILRQQTSTIMSSTLGIGVPVPKMLRQSPPRFLRRILQHHTDNSPPLQPSQAPGLSPSPPTSSTSPIASSTTE